MMEIALQQPPNAHLRSAHRRIALDPELSTKNRDAALALAKIGIPIFASRVTLNDRTNKWEKQPLVRNWQTVATTDGRQITQWWQLWPHGVPGIALGLCDVVVVDADRHGVDDGVQALDDLIEQHGALPDHPVIKTAGGGTHHYFRQPRAGARLGNRTGALPRGIDIRAQGGWVVAPGAIRPDGKAWSGSISAIIPEIPAWIVKLIQAPRPELNGYAGPTTPPVEDAPPCGERERIWALSALDGCEAELADAQEGDRNNRLNAIAFRLGRLAARGWLTESEIRPALWNACLRNKLVDDDPRAVENTISSGLEAGMLDPHPDLPNRVPPPQPAAAPPDPVQPTVAPISVISAILAAPTADEDAWSWTDPDLSLLDDRRGTLPEFPVDVFSETCQAWLKRAALGAGGRIDHVALPFLGISSGLIGIARRVRPTPAWSQPLTLWVALLGRSGERKSPGLRVSTRTLDFIERNNKEQVTAARLAHETKKQKAKETRDRWKDERDKARKETPPREPVMPKDAIDPGNFIEPRLYCSDSTVERLADLLLVRPRGMLLIRDELAGLFENLRRYSNGNDSSFWLKAWDGDRCPITRKSGDVIVDYLLIGLTGAFQPDKMARSFRGDQDGMYGRFLYAWPTPPAYRPLDDTADDIDTDLVNALSLLIRLPAESEDGGQFTPRDIRLSVSAKAHFEQFRQEIDTLKKTFDGREHQWVCKAENHVLRISGTLAYVAWAFRPRSGAGVEALTTGLEPEEIAGEFMTAAIRLWREYLLPHARASLRQIGLSDHAADARRVLNYLRATQLRIVSIEIIRREAMSQSIDANQTITLIGRLEQSGWLRKVHAKLQKGRGRPAHRWEVNPLIF